MNTQKWKKEHLFLDHISRIATKIKERCPDKEIIIWDDMMREIDISILNGISYLKLLLKLFKILIK